MNNHNTDDIVSHTKSMWGNIKENKITTSALKKNSRIYSQNSRLE